MTCLSIFTSHQRQRTCVDKDWMKCSVDWSLNEHLLKLTSFLKTHGCYEHIQRATRSFKGSRFRWALVKDKEPSQRLKIWVNIYRGCQDVLRGSRFKWTLVKAKGPSTKTQDLSEHR